MASWGGMEDILSNQVIEALDFLNWAIVEMKQPQQERKKMRLIHEFASDCHAVALRNLCDHLLAPP